ncbi:ribonuclease H-like domain-containing protein, partial [Chloroflexota bacterium]
MPSLSDKLKALGVQVGSENLPKPQRANYPIEKVIEGKILSKPQGDVFVVETVYPLGHPHGSFKLALSAPMEMMAEWAKDPEIQNTPLEGYAFIDTETTGLAGGSGTYAFMIGVGRFEEEQFRLAQFFMRDPAEEPAMLTALEEFLIPCQTVVSFNGKAFDLPLIEARYITNGAPPPLKGTPHLDLLHLARRLWRQRLPSRALGYLEEHILGQTRSEEDTPGWLIPEMYFDYLRSGDARPLKGVFYHNAMDILSMVTLTEHTAHMLADPLGSSVEHALDLVALGRLHQDLGYPAKAVEIFCRGLEQDLPPETYQATVKRLSYLHRRLGELPEALSLWWQAASDREIYAHEELAKYYEHRAKDYPEAIRWTEAALALL